MKTSFYSLERSVDQQYKFDLVAPNNEEILHSELYQTKQACLKGMASVRRHGEDLNNFELLTSKDGRPYFVLKARNGEIIGTSQMYSSDQTRETGIKAVQNYSDTRKVIDRTTGNVSSESYRFMVDQDIFLSQKAKLTGSEILQKAGLVPVAKYGLRKLENGNQASVVELNQEADLSEPGIERFVTILKDVQDG